MLKYEWKKLLHSPAALLLAAFFIIVKLTFFGIQWQNNDYSAMDQVIDEFYLGLTPVEVQNRISKDLADAQAEEMNNEVYDRYNAGMITIDEVRAWEEGNTARLNKIVGLENLQNRLKDLMELQVLHEAALANPQIENAQWIARWKPLELLHENGWNVMLQIEQISFLGYIVLLLIIPIFSEFQDSRMDIVVRVSRNGLTMSNRAKQSLSCKLLLGLWGLDCLIDYGLPGFAMGYGDIHAAIQSVSAFKDVILPWNLGTYLAACCILKLGAMFFLMLTGRVACLFVHTTLNTLLVVLAAYTLLDVLSPWTWAVDRMITPSDFFLLNLDPAHVAWIIGVYLLVFALLWVIMKAVPNSRR